jgi:hypothetical protein
MLEKGARVPKNTANVRVIQKFTKRDPLCQAKLADTMLAIRKQRLVSIYCNENHPEPLQADFHRGATRHIVQGRCHT